MKRIVASLLGCGVLVIALTAAGSAPRPANESSRRTAERDAARLLLRLALPSRAVRLAREPRGDGGLLKQAQSIPAGPLVDRHRLWLVHEPLRRVVAFVDRRPPRGRRTSGTGSAGGTGIPANASMTFSFPALAGHVSLRQLEVTLAALPHRSTGVRADAQEIWVVSRPPSEKVPSAVREVDVRSSRAYVRVTAAATVRRIVWWFDELPIVQPGGTYHCPPDSGKEAAMTLRFRSANGALLAHARVPHAALDGICAPTEFWIGDHREKPLRGERLYERVSRLLGVRFG